MIAQLTKERFQYLWESATGTFVKFLNKRNIKHFQFRDDSESKVVTEIYNAYTSLRDQLKSDIHSKENPIDRHRIAALLTLAILKVRPYETPPNQTNSTKSLAYPSLNEHFALTLAQVTLYFFICAHLKQVNRKKYDRFKGTGLKLPKTNHGNFRDNLIKTFYKFDSIKDFESAFSLLNLAGFYYLFEISTLDAL